MNLINLSKSWFKLLLSGITLLVASITAFAQRFPQPDFESGYVYPEPQHFPIPNEPFWAYFDIALLVLLMGLVAWAVLKRKIRWPVILTSVISVAYFGFFRNGCVCSIGAVQNVALATVSSTYVLPLFILLLFLLPVIFALFWGRVFCAGVCPLGAVQEVVNIKNYKLSKAVTSVLGLFPWIYLGFAVLFAITNSGFIICRYDPFVGIFRLGGEFTLLFFGIVLLIFSIFTGRPFCRFICPYGAILSLFSSISFRKVKITDDCINCELCHNACPVDAILPPYENKVKESRSEGVKRILRYLVILPLMVIAGAIIMYSLSDKLSRANKDVRLYDMVMENEASPQPVQSLELQSFYGQEEKTVEQLAAEVAVIKKEFRLYSGIIGAFLGLVIGFTLIGLSTKRTRKFYEVDNANCVGCGRCFSYCPQNIKHDSHKIK